jgi:hypothetical protein
MALTRHYARRPFGYSGTQLDRGQIFNYAGLPNDDKLQRLGYSEPLPKGADEYECRYCPAKFIGMAERDSHGRERHASHSLTPHEQDQREEQKERMLNEVAPLHLDKTKASREARA